MTTPTLTQRVIDRLVSGPLGKQILEEEERDALALRKEKVAQLATLTADFEAALPAVVGASTKAQARVQAAQTAVEAATAAWREADTAERNLRVRFDSQRDRLQADLVAEADPEINAFIHDMGVLFEKTRRTPIDVSGGTLDVWTGRRSPLTSSNGATVRAQLVAINEARLQAEELRLQPLTRGEVAERLAELRESIEKAGEAK